MEPKMYACGLLVIALGCACGQLAGVKSGWGYFHKDHVDSPYPYQPPVELTVELGWWNSTTILSMSKGFPSGNMAMEDGAARSLGAFTATIIALSAATSLAGVAYLLGGEHVQTRVYVQTRTLSTISLVTSVLVLCTTIFLYIALAVGMGSKTKEKFGERMTPRPDWAVGLGVLCSAAWGLVCYILYKDAASESLEGYTPIHV